MPRSQPVLFAHWLREVFASTAIPMALIAQESQIPESEITAFLANPKASTKGMRRDLYEITLHELTKATAQSKNVPVIPAPGTTRAYFTGSYGEHAGTCLSLLCDAIVSARSSVYVMAFCIASTRFINALDEVAQTGRKVRVIHDSRVFKPKGKSLVEYVADHSNRRHHNKILLIDHSILFTGSFNFTEAADRQNAENMLRCEDPHVVESYVQHWEKSYRALIRMPKQNRGA